MSEEAKETEEGEEDPGCGGRVKGEERNWADLPADVLSVIFEKLGAIEVLFSAQAVCRPWWRLSLEPQVWRCIDFRKGVWDYFDFGGTYDLQKVGRVAVDRSAGQLVDISLEHLGSDELLRHIAIQTTQLRCLRLVSCYQISDEGFIEIAKKFPLLEVLDISYCSQFSDGVIATVTQLCSHLKHFHLNCTGYRSPHIEYDDEALAVASNLPELRKLQFFGNKLTNIGLQAILDGCPHLEYLDLRQCFNVKLEGTLRKRCEKIRDLRCPNDPTIDYPFLAEIADDGLDYDMDEISGDEDYLSYYSDVELMYDDFFVEYFDGGDIADILF